MSSDISRLFDLYFCLGSVCFLFCIFGFPIVRGNSFFVNWTAMISVLKSWNAILSFRRSVKAQVRTCLYYSLIILKDLLQVNITRISPNFWFHSDSLPKRQRSLLKSCIRTNHCQKILNIRFITILPAKHLDASRYRRTI